MIEKNKTLQQIDEAISRKSTSLENKELFKELRKEFVEAKTKEEHTKIILKIAGAIGAVAKLGSTITKIFSNSG